MYNLRLSRLSLLLELQLNEDSEEGLLDDDVKNHSHHRKTGIKRTYIALFKACYARMGSGDWDSNSPFPCL